MTTYEKKQLGGVICLCVSALGIVLTAIIIMLAGSPESDPMPTYDRAEVTDVVAPSNERYTLREHENIIGIFDGNGTLIGSIDHPTIALPASERARLADGITVESREALERLIESYS